MIGVAVAITASGLALYPPALVAADEALHYPRVAAEVPVTATDLPGAVGNNSPQLARDPTNRRFMVLANRRDAPRYGCALQVSGDGGASWVTASPVPKLPAGAATCYAPEVAFDRRGRIYYLFVGLAGPGNTPIGVYLTISSDRARTFSPPRKLLGPQRFGVRMAIDQGQGTRGRIHLAWLEARSALPLGGFGPTPNPIMASFSDDGGSRFSAPVQVSDPARARVVAPALALGEDHRVHVGYYDLGSDVRDYQGLEGPAWEGDWSLVVSTSSDGGRSFGRGSVVDAGIVPPERVLLIYTMPPAALAAGPSGRVYAAWHDGRNGDWDVFVRRSDDAGRTWSKPTRVNDDPKGDQRHQYLPRLAVAPDGRLDVIFYDRRRDRTNRGVDVSYAFSSDHGAHFSTNIRVSVINFDSQIGQQYAVPSAQGRHEFGARLALLSDDHQAVGAWTDTRNTERITGTGRVAQDIYAAVIDVKGPTSGGSSGGSGPVVMPLVGVGALAAATMVAGRRRVRRRASTSRPASEA